MNDPTATLGVLIQVAIALVGFAGVFAALGKNDWNEVHSLRLKNLLLSAFLSLVIAGVCLVLLHTAIAENLIWKAASGAWLCSALVGMVMNYGNIRRLMVLDPGSFSKPDLALINGSLWLLAGMQIYNLGGPGSFWIVLSGIIWMFAMACFSFTRLVLAHAKSMNRSA